MIRASPASTSIRPFPTSRVGWRPNASTRRSARSRSTRPRASRSSAACTRPSTGRRRSRRSRPVRRPDATTSRPTAMWSTRSMHSCATSAGIAASSSSGTRRGATTWNGSSAGASTPTARCAAGWSRGAPRGQRQRPREVGPRRHVPPRANLQARDAALVCARVQHVRRDAAGRRAVRPGREPRRQLSRAARRLQARDRLHEPRRPRHQPIGPVDARSFRRSRSPQGR